MVCRSYFQGFANYKMDLKSFEKILGFSAPQMDLSRSDSSMIFCDCLPFLFFGQIFNFLFLLLVFESFTNPEGKKKHLTLPDFERSEPYRLSEGECKSH